ncbi:FAD-dependent oxidoreductase [Bacillus sp. Marseille-Q1617]|uniref:FAD-dependent oxidoreductase n=1 Tax=Bacillus sp. Marseille-Q1617 TaxID=2736887 RepID=UPI00158D68B3|nr:FAD-dependent oxidoreductase [Bacillus sp. Marseille-Q1617]
MFECIIAGGGIHGCTIANYLVKKKKIPVNQICVIDPHREPLAKWKLLTQRIEMPYLRSPAVHHLDLNPFSLHSFKEKNKASFFGYYKRPSLDLFNKHSEHVLEEIEIQKAWKQGYVEKVSRKKRTWEVQLDSGDIIMGRNLIIATGMNNRLSYPGWGEELVKELPNQAGHVFQDKLPFIKAPIAVIGGGISAAHLVVKLSKAFKGGLCQISRHPYRVKDFDSDPGWLGPKNMNAYQKLSSFTERREVIQKARHKGSMPRELVNRLRWLQKEHAFTFIQDEVESWEKDSDGIRLKLMAAKDMTVQTVLFATGFSPDTMRVEWLEDLIKQEKLTCANCGFPVVKENLEWCDHLFVSGPLAELEIGPAARNISGARKAAQRIADSL